MTSKLLAKSRRHPSRCVILEAVEPRLLLTGSGALEVWAGNTDLTSNSDAFFSPDQNGYTQLGVTNLQNSAVNFDAGGVQYNYFVLVSRGKVDVSSIVGSDSVPLTGFGFTGDASQNGSTITIGTQENSGGTFAGYAEFANPNAWTGLTVQTGSMGVMIQGQLNTENNYLPGAADPFDYNCSFGFDDNGLVVAGKILSPTGETLPLTLKVNDGGSDDHWRFKFDFASAAARSAVIPNGTYTFVLTSALGTTTTTFSYTQPSLSPVPAILGLTDGETGVSLSPTFTFGSINDPNPNDYLDLSVSGPDSEFSLYEQQLSTNTTTYDSSALDPSSNYNLDLSLQSFVNTANSDGFGLNTGTDNDTSLLFRTAGTAAPAPGLGLSTVSFPAITIHAGDYIELPVTGGNTGGNAVGMSGGNVVPIEAQAVLSLSQDWNDPANILISEGPVGSGSGGIIGGDVFFGDGPEVRIPDTVPAGMYYVGLKIDSTGVVAGNTGNTVVFSIAQITIAAGASTPVLAFFPQPAATGTTGTQPAIVVEISDASGHLRSTDNSNVTLALASGPSGATLGGTLTVAAVGGIAIFKDVSLVTAGDYTLTATDGGDVPATSTSFTLSAPVAIGGADPTFGSPGPAGTSTVVSVLPQAQIISIDSLSLSSGQILSAGVDSTSNAVVLTRFNADGSTDASFGDSGVLRASLPAGFTGAHVHFDVASGTIYVTGTVASTGQPAATRLSQSGAIDAGFGTAGILSILPLNIGDDANVIVPCTDKVGGFLVGGAMTVAGARNAVVLRILSSGAINLKFGAKGFYLRPGSALDAVTDIAFGPKAIIYATGLTSTDGSTTRTLAIRLTSAGKFDKTFGPGTLSVPGAALSSGTKVTVQSDAKVLITTALANSSDASGTGVALVRLTTKGIFDATFNGVGYSIVRAIPSVTASAVRVYKPQGTGGGVRQLFDQAADSMATVPGGKVREVAATADNSGDSTITQTQIISDAVSLVAGPITLSIKKPYKPNAKVSLTLKAYDTGTLPTPATAPVALYFSSVPVHASDDASQSVSPVKLGLKAGTSKNISISFKSPTIAGTYYIIVVLDSGTGAFQNLNAAQGTAVSPAAITVAGATPKVLVNSLVFADVQDVWKRLFDA